MLHGEDRSADSSDRAPAFGFQNIVGASPLLREAISLATQVAGTRRTTVLLIGETGTGKELFARGIHYASAAADEPFVAINCAAIPESLLESELFGHERGAFTGAHARKQGLLELAGSGTLFLDEVHHLPRMLQPKLLRALESRAVRRLGGFEEFAIECRIVAAASPLLEQVVASGEFREDLYYRLNVFSITLPPLRERLEDVEVIARHFLGEETREHQQPKRVLRRRDRRAARASLAGQRARAEERRRARGDPQRRLADRARRASDDSAAHGARSGADDAIGEIRIPRAGKLLDDDRARGGGAHAQDHERQSGGGGATARHLASDAGEEDDSSASA